MVFDTETNHDIHKQLLWVKEQCKEIGWNLILTNPEFEFWLLMHVTDVSNYKDKLIRSNKKVKSKRTFLSKEFSNILPDGYRKSNIRPKRFIDNINFAIEQATKYFSYSLDDVLDDVGTNIHVMIQKMKIS